MSNQSSLVESLEEAAKHWSYETMCCCPSCEGACPGKGFGILLRQAKDRILELEKELNFYTTFGDSENLEPTQEQV